MALDNIATQLRSTLDLMRAEHSRLSEQIGAVERTLNQLGAPARRGPGRPPKSAGIGKPAAAKPAAAVGRSGGGKINTRTVEGRKEYDSSVQAALQQLGGKDVRAKDLRAVAGGTPEQVRTALDRLVEVGSVSSTGQASGVRYSLR